MEVVDAVIILLFLCFSFALYTRRGFCTEKVASAGVEGMVQTEHLELSRAVLEEADVLYVTRIQKERFASEEVCPPFRSFIMATTWV